MSIATRSSGSDGREKHEPRVVEASENTTSQILATAQLEDPMQSRKDLVRFEYPAQGQLLSRRS